MFGKNRVLGRKDGTARVIADAGGKADTIRMYVGKAAGSDTTTSDSSATDNGSGSDSGDSRMPRGTCGIT